MGGVSIFDFFSDRLCWAQCMARRDSYFVKWGGAGCVGFVVSDRVAPSSNLVHEVQLRPRSPPRSPSYYPVQLRRPRPLSPPRSRRPPSEPS